VTRQAKLEAIARDPARFVEYIEFSVRYWLSCAAKEVSDNMTSSTAPELRTLFSRAPKSKLREFRSALERELGGDSESIQAKKDRFVMTTSTSGSALRMFQQTVVELAPLVDLDELQRYLDSHERFGPRWRTTELELAEARSSESARRPPRRSRRKERPTKPRDPPVELLPIENHATIIDGAPPPPARLLVKLMSIAAVDETDPEMGEDTILAAAAFTGPNGVPKGGEAFLVGSFDDGDRVDFSPHRQLYYTMIDPVYPQVHAGVFSLVEEDSKDGGDSLMTSLGTVAGLLTLVGIATGAGLTLVVVAVVAVLLGALLESVFEDDLFTPQIDTYEIRSPDQVNATRLFGGKTFGQCSIRQLEWKEHGATYRLVYYWQLVPDGATAEDLP
jgi:hypothetical protein